jgi:hypothetical protein
MSLKGSGVEGLVPSVAMFRGGVFEKWLDYEASDLTSGLIHWWIRNFIVLLEGGRN